MSFVRSLCGSAPSRCATSSRHGIEDALLLHACDPAALSGPVLPLSPNSRSNTRRGLFCVGSGVLALFQLMVLVYGHA